jgi:hypothetical protein
MEAVVKNRNQGMYGVSLILAPLLLAISTFFWIDGEYGVVGGTILILSMVFWMPPWCSYLASLKIDFPIIPTGAC